MRRPKRSKLVSRSQIRESELKPFRGRQLHLEVLESRIVLSATTQAEYSEVSSGWFAELTPVAPLAASTDEIGPTESWIIRLTAEAVQLAGDVTQAAHLLSDLPVSVVRGLGLPGQLLVTSTQQAPAVTTALASSPWVSYFQENARITGAATPNDAIYAFQAGLHNVGQLGGTNDADIDAPEAWNLSTGTSDIIVAVIDSGIESTHPDLAANVWTNPDEIAGDNIDNDNNGLIDDVNGWDFKNGDNGPVDDHGHGTHVSGIIGAVGNNSQGIAGVNWQVSLLPLKFLDQNNSGETADAVAAINYVTALRTLQDANVRVINASWISGTVNDLALQDAIGAAGLADILFVAAAGNGDALGRGLDIDQFPAYPASYNLDNVISVAATDQFDELARFSNYGATSVDIAAPGVGIWSTDLNGSYQSRNGTSMAAPHVAGVAALVLATAPTALATEVKAAILTGGDPKASLQGQVASGNRLNANGALLVDTVAPHVTTLDVDDILVTGATFLPISVDYQDNKLLDIASLDDGDLIITKLTGGGGTFAADFQSVDVNSNGAQRTALYHMAAPGGVWDTFDNGDYQIELAASAVADVTGNLSRTRVLGTFQVDITADGIFEVDTEADAVDANIGDNQAADSLGRVTLRAAVQEANLVAGTSSIILPAGTYTLSVGGTGEDAAAEGDLDVTGNLTILTDGSGEVVIDAVGLDRVFDVHAGGLLTLEGITIRGGTLTGADGAGVRNSGDLTLTQATIRNNTTDQNGGGVANLGILDIEASTFTINSGALGGGVWNSGNTTATNATWSGNLASTSGGGIFNTATGTATLTNVTLTLNSAAGSGSAVDDAGGITSESGGTVQLQNVLIAGNTSVDSSPDVTGPFTTLGGNLIGDATSSTGIPNGPNNDQAGGTGAPIDALLGPLADNSGPTLTHKLLEGSPAVDRGLNAGAPSTDQRGIDRPQDGDGDDTPTVDVGAVERYYVEVNGQWFDDANGNGTRDTGEPGVAGENVFLDINQNGVLDVGEPTTVTADDDPVTTGEDETGNYQFTGLPPGEHSFTVVGRDGWKQTAPLGFTEFRKWVAGAGSNTYRVKHGDLNNDELTDIVVLDVSADRLRVFLNQGDGIFGPSITVNPTIGLFNEGFQIADVDNDGNADLLAWNTSSSSDLSIMWGNGDGTFASPYTLEQTSQNGCRFAHVEVLDLNGDGQLDLWWHGVSGATPTFGGVYSYRIGINDGSRGFNLRTPVQTGRVGRDILIGDLDGDGRKDIVTGNGVGTYLGITVYRNFGNGTVSAATDYELGGYAGPRLYEIADMTGDGKLDVIFGDPNADKVHVLVNNGTAQFTTEYNFDYPGGYMSDLVAADFNGDGSVDLAVIDSVSVPLTFYFNDGVGGFSPAVSTSVVGARPQDGTAFDADEDGDVDLAIISDDGLNEIRVFFNTGGVYELPLYAGQVVSGVDFGEAPKPGEIRGTLFHDIDDDGVRDLSETFLEGWTVYLDNDDSNTLTAGDTEAVTDVNGEFVFPDLTPFASYAVRVEVQTDWHVTLPSIGDDFEWTVSIDPGESFSGADFGLFDDNAQGGGSASIAGRVFDDANGNGTMDVGERGLGGRTVYLDVNDNSVYEPAIDVGTQTTVHPMGFPGDVGGFYSFDGLGARNFVVRLEASTGELTSNPAGNAYTIEEFSVGANPVEVVSADFDKNGKPDLATVDGSSNQVSVRLQDLAGEFGPSAVTSVGLDPTGLAVGDFNNDTFLDIAVVHFSLSKVVLLINNQDGSFTRSPTEFTVPSGLTRIVTADFNDDQLDDLAVAVDGPTDVVRVLINNGTGGFNPLPDVSLGTGAPLSITVGLLDGDIYPDLVVGNFDSDTVQVIKNNSGTTFTALSPVSVGDSPSAVALADMNTDNFLDVVVANFGTDNVAILLGDGLGGLGTPSYVAAGQGPRAVVAADIDDDADLDLIVANVTGDDVVVLRNQGGSFGFAESSGAASFAGLVQQGVKSLLAADLDGDGLVDAAAVNGDFSNGTVLVLNNFKSPGSHRLLLDGSSSIAAQDFGVTLPVQVANADFDGDSDVDGADFLAWQRGLGTLAPNAQATDGDADNDQDVDNDDLSIWLNQYGPPAPLVAAASIPEVENTVAKQKPSVVTGSFFIAQVGAADLEVMQGITSLLRPFRAHWEWESPPELAREQLPIAVTKDDVYEVIGKQMSPSVSLHFDFALGAHNKQHESETDEALAILLEEELSAELPQAL